MKKCGEIVDRNAKLTRLTYHRANVSEWRMLAEAMRVWSGI